jgi:hypothetical protein
LVEKALRTLEYVLDHPPIDGPIGEASAVEIAEAQLKVSAAQAVLQFVVAVAPQSIGCDHAPEKRTNVSTMGGGPLREVCACGAQLEDGVLVGKE